MFTRTLTTALVASALVAPAAVAQPIDTGPPDIHASLAQAAAAEHHKQDLRSPDARDAALAQERQYSSYPAYPSPEPTGSAQDLRSPDTRDAAEGRGTFNAPDVAVVKVPQTAPSSSGFEWDDAGIGAGIVFGLMLLTAGATVAVVRQRRRTAISG
jgi:hypothetical protein